MFAIWIKQTELKAISSKCSFYNVASLSILIYYNIDFHVVTISVFCSHHFLTLILWNWALEGIPLALIVSSFSFCRALRRRTRRREVRMVSSWNIHLLFDLPELCPKSTYICKRPKNVLISNINEIYIIVNKITIVCPYSCNII